MRDILRILVSVITRAQISQSVRGTRGYRYMAGVTQTPKLSSVFDGGNHVLNRLGDHGLERGRGDVVEGKRGRIRATASIIVGPPLLWELGPTVFCQVARLMTKSTRGTIVNCTGALRPLNHLSHLKSCLRGLPLRGRDRVLRLPRVGKENILPMKARHKSPIGVDDLRIIHLPFKQVCFNLLGEALTNPRDLLSLGVRGIKRRLVKKESEGIAKTL
jgi:hypothetical protein